MNIDNRKNSDQLDIIRMAREAGFEPNSSYTVLPMKDYASNGVSYELERFAALVAAHVREKLAEQGPVAEVIVRPLRGDQSQPTTDIKWLQKPTTGKLYAAPVRTKELTDDEIHKCDRATVTRQDFARAVIAADREKNRG